jgi:hypothetical protein
MPAEMRSFCCPDGEPVRWEWVLPLRADGYCLACTWRERMIVFVPPGVALWGPGEREVESWRCARWRDPAQLAFGVDADAARVIAVIDLVRIAPAKHWPSIEEVTREHQHALRWFHATAPRGCSATDPDAAHAAKASRSLERQLQAATLWTSSEHADEDPHQPACTALPSDAGDSSRWPDESFRASCRTFT